jgi:transcriptional regulator with XRE-family HTH domain
MTDPDPHDERDPEVVLARIGGLDGLAEMTRRVREDRGLSRAKLAERVGRKPKFIEQIENARAAANAHVLTVTLLARASEVSVGLFVASYARPKEDPLPWPRERRPASAGVTAAHDRSLGAAALGATLRELRVRQKGWPQRELAERTKMNQRYLSALELGSVPNPLLLTITRLGRAFGDTPPTQIAYATRLAQAYAGEIDAPPLGRPYGGWSRRRTS